MQKLPPDNELIRLHKQKTIKEISFQFGVSRQAVSERLRNLGVTGRWIDRQLDAKICEMRNNGETIQAIAEKINQPYYFVAKALVRNGVSTSRRIKLPGCSKCKTKPYALGYCRNCYIRHHRKNKREKDKMKCPACKALTVILHTEHKKYYDPRTNKINSGLQRQRFCNFCQCAFKTFQPKGNQEVISDYVELCECGNVVTKELPIRAITVERLKVKSIKVCNTCFELEQKLGKCSYLV